MKQIISNFKSGKIILEEVPVPYLEENGVLVRNCYSLVSPGTEKMILDLARKNLFQKAKERPDLVKRVKDKLKKEGIIPTIRKVFVQLEAPLPLGYSCSGIVQEVGVKVKDISVGDRVACAGAGYANHAEVNYIPRRLCVKIPNEVSFAEGAFVTLASIALQGVRQADVKLGETVVVIGLGLLGLLTSQLLKIQGNQVIGIEPDPYKIDLARELGIDFAINPKGDDISSSVMNRTSQMGADATIITASTSSNEPIENSANLTRLKGKVVVVGLVGMDIPRNEYYKKEIELKLSMSYGPGRYDPNYEELGLDYPFGYVRWTEERNMMAIVNLLAGKKLAVSKLITHEFNFSEAVFTYKQILNNKIGNFAGILFKYPDTLNSSKMLMVSSKAMKTGSVKKVTVGLIGSGNYANSVLYPILQKRSDVILRSLATARSFTAGSYAKKYGCAVVTTDYQKVLADPEINTVFITTRHHLHAEQVINALKAGKNVFVEKPLTLKLADLEKLVVLFQDHPRKIMVGYNRRFAPHTQKVLQFFSNRKQPLAINYRINAGMIPLSNWIQQESVGGGRILGEICHFVDFLQAITRAVPIRVFSDSASFADTAIPDEDVLSTIIKFSDGSLATIHYFANGDTAIPKENIEIFGENKIFIIRDFKEAQTVSNGQKKKYTLLNQDKGQKKMIDTFITSILDGTELTPSFESLCLTSLTTFKIIESLKSGKSVQI